jgi:CDP-paratose 2-epimerase
MRSVPSKEFLAAFERAEALAGTSMRREYADKARDGDHVCYISKPSKIQGHYLDWEITKAFDDIFTELMQVRKACAAKASPC